MTPEASAKATPNLYQRLASIAGEVKGIKATGRTAQNMGNQSTLSISDIEDALRPLMAKHGVVVRHSWNAEPKVVEQSERGFKVYQVDLTIRAINADDPADAVEDRVIDFASSPSGGVSFALKRYYRALFHLADDEESPQAGVAERPSSALRGGSAPAPRAPQGPPAAAPKSEAGAVQPVARGAAEKPQSPSSDPLVREAQTRLGVQPPAGAEVPPSSPATGPSGELLAELSQLRHAGGMLKSPATDKSLLAMARGKYRGLKVEKLEDLTIEQVKGLQSAISSLVDLQNVEAGAADTGPTSKATEPGVLDPAGDEDVPF